MCYPGSIERLVYVLIATVSFTPFKGLIGICFRKFYEAVSIACSIKGLHCINHHRLESSDDANMCMEYLWKID